MYCQYQLIMNGKNKDFMNKTYMIQAINKAWKYQFLTYPNPAVASCVVLNDEILSIGVHKIAGESHAEVNALKLAYLKLNPNSSLKNIQSSYEIHEYLIKNHNNIFNKCELYVTLEPCNHIGKTPSCASLIKVLGLKQVYIGTLDINKTASGGLKTLKDSGIKVNVGLEEQKCKDLLYSYELWQKNKFRFFKLAMRFDGSVDGGYITTQESLNIVHEIRTKLDLLIIGGNTVRSDKPTLDSRFAKNNKASDILIYSNKNEFDKDINLFKIKNRKVFISNNLNKIKSTFSMIEGGYILFETVKNNIDMLMLFISHKNKTIKRKNIDDFGFKKIHSYFINESDEIIFLKPIKS